MTTPTETASKTPRNDELMDGTAGMSDADHLILLDKLSRQLESDLA